MDDDNGLELSLGLSCGGSAKGNAGSSSEKHIVQGGDRSAKVIDDFKNFLHPTSQRPPEPSSGSQRSDSGQQRPPQNFFNDLSKAPTADAEASTKPLWVEDDTTRQEAGNKRKFGFPGMNDEKKKEKDLSADPHEKKTKASHVSNATDEGSTAENEDVAESVVGGGGSSSNLAKEVARPTADANVVDNLAGQRKNSHVGSAKESGQHAAGTSLTQPTANAGNNLPVMFGYSPVQLPMLDKDGSGGIVALSQSPFAGRVPSNSEATAKCEGKQPVAEEGSSEDASEQPPGDNNNNNNISNAFSFDFSAIKPGMAADVKFGGSGARPNLPWVSTTGSGPHGRTISGVTYRYNANQIKIVCACHGSHMSPEEFVRHASEEYVSPESSVGMTAASAHT
ncbi:PREDICTED: AFP homolog 2 isoform X2 [Brassica oleracea var. oleracea]|uniref:AFP homolog 2 isoform X2 n=1 Tax=Brassica oleracea var. oleracea TaxID=109376 RepID=UPI0006A70C46|nr:PREDICTED: AFP homolog 2 isoform X2 [Brassica oleracea var. oleracea]